MRAGSVGRMAENWLRLRKVGKGRRGKSGDSMANPFAASGLEKFATLLEGIQSARSGASLVERTASSLSAARSISRSAQEWTAATLAARRGSSESGTILQCAAFEALAPTPASVVAVVGDWEKNLRPQGRHGGVVAGKVSSAGICLPERPMSRSRNVKKLRSARLHGSWRQTSKSAFVVLVAMSAFVFCRFGKAGRQLAAVLTFSAVIEVWRKGKTTAWFAVSSIAVYSPLRSYLITRMPTRLNLLPRSVKEESTSAMTRSFEVDATANQKNSTQLGFPATDPLESGSSRDDDLAISETGSASVLKLNYPLPVTVVRTSSAASSISRRLAKRISSRFKKLKLFRASSSRDSVSAHHLDAKSEPTGSSQLSRTYSPDKRRMCPFSRRLHKSNSSVSATDPVPQNDESTSRKGILCKKLKPGRLLSSESLEDHNLSASIPASASSSLHGKAPIFTNVEDCNNINNNTNNGNASPRCDVSWPVVGLVLTLLLLLVGQFPAIMATSLFFVVVSNAQDDGAQYSRGRGRDNQALRNLQRSPPPRGQR